MTGPNLSAWAIHHPALIRYLMGLLLLSGAYAYFTLGQMEDPEFTFRGMAITVYWPGATAREMEQQVTDKLEEKLQQTPWLDYISSYSKPGEAVLFILVKESAPPREVPNIWYQVRKKVGDMHHELPSGIQGPVFDDEFGDIFGSIYAFTADGFSYAELKRYVDYARQELLRLDNINKVEIIGAQDEKIYIEMPDKQLAALGINPLPVFSLLAAQNSMESAGVVVTPETRVPLRMEGNFNSLDSIRAIGIRGNDRTFRLGDVAEVWRGYEDPPVFKMRFMGQEAIGLAVSMVKGGDILQLGVDLRRAFEKLQAELPIGIDIHQVTDQPRVVRAAINEFMKTFLEALVIVLAVTFFSLGWRAGVVVALCIPLVLAMTFLGMKLFGIDLHRVSLGALIIALGLLVDDAIIVMEMIDRKLELGWEPQKAATFAYTSTAFPMLTGTLVTVAGFLPIGLAQSSAGEYTFGLFAVVGIALISSWLVAVLFTPYLGYLLLPQRHADDAAVDSQRAFSRRSGRFLRWRQRYQSWVIRGEEAINDGLLRLVEGCLRHYRWVITLTVMAFILAVIGFGFVPQQFFPSSARPELLVDVWLPEGSSFAATEAEVKRLEARLLQEPGVVNVVSYVGSGSPYFYLSMEKQLDNRNYAQLVVMNRDEEAREAVLKSLNRGFEEDFPAVRGRASRLENGPPVVYPVQFRVVGPDAERLRTIAGELIEVMRAHPSTRDVHTDWRERILSVRLRVDQDKARALGIDAQTLSRNLNAVLSGMLITQYREGDRTIDVLLRTRQDKPGNLESLKDLQVYTDRQRFVPLGQIAYIEKAFEDGVVWRRDRFPAITVVADLPDGVQPLDVTAQIDRALEPLRARLPDGYRIEIGGAQEASANSQGSIFAVMPLMMAVILTLLMIQLHSFSRTLLVLLTAPLGIIGVTLFLLVFQQPFGFVAMLGVIALSGIIIRNAVILLDQIDQDLQAGISPWDAVVGSTVRRFRPIMLTALTAILALIPLTQSTFWAPLAVAIMGGLLVATILDRLALPAMYAAWFQVRPPAS
ncbi:MAG TPA: efflux RND transporter permease subunit [Candidatus Competibacteraceae bacterium]|nr:efflux RND transporter permease subunit [Candidatus Competibacteraceae bacterium]HRZ06056.1 efflux RND transporter permease subunit [Candidatus Competibacteraceae bacterium]HSA45418.1 efflux RND transporter permease subunit [Candidatus Competibacteraceae bacterium]